MLQNEKRDVLGLSLKASIQKEYRVFEVLLLSPLKQSFLTYLRVITLPFSIEFVT